MHYTWNLIMNVGYVCMFTCLNMVFPIWVCEPCIFGSGSRKIWMYVLYVSEEVWIT